MKRRALLLALAFAGTAAQAADLQAEVLKRLDNPPVLQGEFEQTRQLKGFRNPLVSKGGFLLARQRGIVWQTRQPFASTLVLTRDALLARRADGSVAQKLDTGREPALRIVNELMFALLGGDLGALGKHFRIEGELQGAAGWTLRLAPTEAMLSGQFVQIGLEGDKQVQRVRIEERNGDVTQIRFAAQRASRELLPADAQRFEGAHGG